MKNTKYVLRLSTALASALTASLFVSSFTAPAYAQETDEVITVGTLIKRKAQANRSSPVVTFDAEDIDSVGAKSIADLTQTLTINTGAENNPDAFTQNGTTGTSNINLRGLGVQSTLVLLNGRRQVLSGAVTNAGFNFVDTASLVPLIAVENLEILKDGASAIYGSDAVAGVVNFSTYDNFDGLRLSGQYQTVTGEGSSDEILLQALVGKNFERGNVLAAASYTDRSPLTTAERRLSRPQDDTSALGNPGTFFPVAGPAAGTPLIDPGCEANGGFRQGIGALPDFIPGAAAGLPLDVGSCGFDFGEFFNLIAEEERFTGYLQADFDVTDSIRWRGEFSYADNEAVRGNSPTFPFLQTAIVPATNPNFLPELAALGTPAAVFFGRAIGNGGDVSPNLTESETWRFSTELEGDFGNSGADWRLSYTQAENNHVIFTEDTLVDEFRCSLEGSCASIGGPSGFFNPFSTSFTTAPNSPEILDFIIGTQVRDLTSELQVFDAVVTTPIGDTDAAIAFGFQYRNEDYSGEFDANSQADNFGFLIGEQNFEGDQDVVAFFSEVVVPISDQFELQGALRYEDYGGEVGDTLDPKIAFLYRPADYVSLRGSFSTSFRAPSVSQQFSQQTALSQVVDPLGGTAFVAARTFGPSSIGGQASGAAALSPEQSEAFNLGITFRPTENWSIDLDLYSFDFTDVITAENPQAVVNADPNDPTRVIRSAGGTITQINTNFVNAGSVETSGIDFGVNYTWETDYGTFVPFVQGTYVLDYDLDDPQLGEISGAGSRNFNNFGTSVPELRFNTGFNWVKDAHRLDVFGRFIDSFEDDQNDNINIDSHFTVDARYALNIGEYFSSALIKDTAFTVGVINAFDQDPPQVFTNGGFDSKVHDPRGRLLYVGLDVTF